MDYTKMSKLDLLKVLNRLKADIPQYKERGEETKLKRAMKAYQTVRELFYECPYCLHAKVETTVDKNGKEVDRVVELCNFGKCPYHQDFVNMAEEVNNTIDKALKQMLLT